MWLYFTKNALKTISLDQSSVWSKFRLIMTSDCQGKIWQIFSFPVGVYATEQSVSGLWPIKKLIKYIKNYFLIIWSFLVKKFQKKFFSKKEKKIPFFQKKLFQKILPFQMDLYNCHLSISGFPPYFQILLPSSTSCSIVQANEAANEKTLVTSDLIGPFFFIWEFRWHNKLSTHFPPGNLNENLL